MCAPGIPCIELGLGMIIEAVKRRKGNRHGGRKQEVIKGSADATALIGRPVSDRTRALVLLKWDDIVIPNIERLLS